MRRVLVALVALTVAGGCERVPSRNGPPPTLPTEDAGASVVPGAGPQPGRTLVRSSSDVPFSPGHPELAIDPDAIRFDGVEIVAVQRSAVVEGPGDAPSDFAPRSLVEVLDRAARASGSPDPMLTIVPAPSTRYLLFLRVISAVRRAGFASYQFPVTDASGRTHAIVMDVSGFGGPETRSGDADARSPGERVSAALPSLGLLARWNGFVLSRREGALPGAEPGFRVVTVPRRTDWQRVCSSAGPVPDRQPDETFRPCALDFEALRARLAAIHEQYPEERALTFGGLCFVEWETLVAIMDAARDSGGRALYPNFVFAQAMP